jgi:hypothetical protein
MASNKQGDQEIPLSTDQQTTQSRSEGIARIIYCDFSM